MPRSLIVQSSLNYFPADQPEATNFIHLPSTQYLHNIYSTFSIGGTFGIQSNSWG